MNTTASLKQFTINIYKYGLTGLTLVDRVTRHNLEEAWDDARRAYPTIRGYCLRQA